MGKKLIKRYQQRGNTGGLSLNTPSINFNAPTVPASLQSSFPTISNSLQPQSMNGGNYIAPSIDTKIKASTPPTTLPTIKSNNSTGNGSSFKDKANKLFNSNGFKLGSQIGEAVLGALPNADNKFHNTTDQAVKGVKSSVQGALMSSGNPWLMAAGAVNKISDVVGASANASKGLGAGNDALNTVASFVPFAGIFAGKTAEMEVDKRVSSSSAYSGVNNDVSDAQRNAGAKLLFGGSKANFNTWEANNKQSRASNILDTADINKEISGSPLYSQRTQMAMSRGYDMLAAKQGAKLYNRQAAQDILKKKTSQFKDDVKEQNPDTINEPTTKLKDGGTVNVIPEGALHKNKHHLEDIDEKFEEVTNKGIPVITESDSGKIQQQAEVEKEEIIFRLEVTKKLEELAKKHTDEAAIEAGKLLTEEVLHNTIDKTNNLL